MPWTHAVLEARYVKYKEQVYLTLDLFHSALSKTAIRHPSVIENYTF